MHQDLIPFAFDNLLDTKQIIVFHIHFLQILLIKRGMD